MAAGDEQVYVYALAEGALPQRLSVLGRSLRTLRVGDVAVILERAGPARPPTTARLQEQHGIVTRLAQRLPALLPARYGAIISRTRLSSLLIEHQAEILKSLTMVREQTQMTVRVFGEPAPSPAPPDAIVSGTDFLQRRRDRARHATAEADRIRAILGPVTAERIEPGRGGVRLSVFHLIPSAAVQRYSDRAPALQSLLAPDRVTVTGPWPAFAFAPELF